MSARNGYEQYAKWPREILEANVAFMRSFSRKLSETGELVSNGACAAPTQACRVPAGDDGRPVTDGVFPETKEFLAGWWIVDVPSEERAFELAAAASEDQGLRTRRRCGSRCGS